MRRLFLRLRQPILWMFVCTLITKNNHAQSVGIGTATPDPSARLQVSSTSQGFLMPTLTAAQRSAIVNPAKGLLVFQTDGTMGLYYFDGSGWINLTNGFSPNGQGFTVSSTYGTTSTFAGSGNSGSADGQGILASFSDPFGAAVDVAGNVYVADMGNNTIRKITGGIVTTIAGNGSNGSADGQASSASFWSPGGVAVDAAGNVYVADKNNHNIRKITPGGTVSTLAGAGVGGPADGQGASAYFRFPTGVAVDAAGNVYVADRGNHKIRKITPGGLVTTFAGSNTPGKADGQGASASFNQPYGIAIDTAGNLYVTDNITNNIRKITPGGMVTTLAGSGYTGSADGQGASASFNYPVGIAVDAIGNVYVADRDNNKIRKITPDGTVSTLAGSSSNTAGSLDGKGSSATFFNPTGIAVDATGNVYVAEEGNLKIRKIIAW